MAKTLSSFKPSIINNEWMFSVTSEDKNQLELALGRAKSIHSNRFKNPKVIEDPDVLGFYTLGGSCKSKDDAVLMVQFIENTLHAEKETEDVYDWPPSND